MFRAIILSILLITGLAPAASAQPAYRYSGWGTLVITPRHHVRPHRHTSHVPHARHTHRHHYSPPATAMAHETRHAAGGLIPGLAAKVAEIMGACRSRVISGVRPGAVVAGSGRPSLHRDGRAADLAGNPGCIYAHLRGWPGGYSVDYGAVHHVHISLGGREDGVRFAHHSGLHHAMLYSRGWHPRPWRWRGWT